MARGQIVSPPQKARGDRGTDKGGPPWSVRAASATDRGRVRRNNEDSCLVALEQKLFIVSDGMGGHQAGEIASRAVVSVLPKMVEQRLAGVSSPRARVIELALREAVVGLSRRLREQSAGHVGLKGMGATVVLAWLRGSEGMAHLAHMGDSRIYLFRQYRLTQLTEDHSVVALLVKHAEITPEEAREHPARGRLSRYVGMEGDVYPDVRTVNLQDGDRVLLCTDGLTDMVPDEQIAVLLRASPDPEATCQALVAAANTAGGRDNVSAIVIYIAAASQGAEGARPCRVGQGSWPSCTPEEDYAPRG